MRIVALNCIVENTRFLLWLSVVACTGIKKIIPTEFENKNRDVQNPVKMDIWM